MEDSAPSVPAWPKAQLPGGLQGAAALGLAQWRARFYTATAAAASTSPPLAPLSPATARHAV